MAIEKIETLAELSQFAERFMAMHPDGGVFGLRGELGVGKTTFVREVVKALCARYRHPLPRVISPSYVLHQLYDIHPSVDHFDFYRLEALSSEGLMEVGYFEALDRSLHGGYVFVEWPERMPQAQAPGAVLRFGFAEKGRTIEF